jgi:tRNA-specific 2-thiouridylase
LNVGGGLPYYVTGKDMTANTVYVTTDLQDDKLWQRQLRLTDMHWINEAPADSTGLQVRTRYRAPLVPVASLSLAESDIWLAELVEDARALTPGQSAVFYVGDRCLGGGIVA